MAKKPALVGRAQARRERPASKKPTVRPPGASRRPQRRTVHGVEFVDDYGWIKAANWQEVLREPRKLPGDIRKLLEAENLHTQAVLKPVQALRRSLVKEMRARIKEDDSSVPAPD